MTIGKWTSTLKRWLTPDPAPDADGSTVTRGVEWDAYGVMKSCLFCDFASQEKDKKLIYEDDNVVAFRPLHDAAKQHILLVPKRHISSVGDLIAEDTVILDRMQFVAKELLKCEDAATTQFSFHIPPWNSVDHIHLHAIEKPFHSWWHSFRFSEGKPWCASFKSVRNWASGMGIEEGRPPLSRVPENPSRVPGTEDV